MRSTYKPDLRADLLSGFLVFLIALPLCLGIAMASSFPPIAGVITAVVGGLIATFFGSAQLSIKGPAAGLIVIALGAVQDLGGGDPVLGYKRATAVVVVSGLLQIVLALCRAGELGDFFPSSVVHGMLAAIGVIIISKQAHTVLGVLPHGKKPIELLAEIPHSLIDMNPEVAVIGILSLLILFLTPRLPFRFARKIPAPMVVMLLGIPAGLLFDLGHEHTYTFSMHSYRVGPKYLLQLPGNVAQALSLPDFSQIFSATSLRYIVMFTLVGSIESLLSAKAVDMLDKEKRHSDLSRDLLAIGVGNTLAGLLGGLPMISEIVRSSANVNNGAKSRYANFFHGMFLLLFVGLLPGVLQSIPLAALGAMLIYTGVRLASPSEFVKVLRIGREQLLLFITTLVVTLVSDLLIGVMSGIALKLILHVKHGAPLRSLFRSHIENGETSGALVLRIHNSAVFSNYLGIKRRIDAIAPSQPHVVLDLEPTRLVDHTVLEKLHQLQGDWQRAGRLLEIRGLHDHESFSSHELAARRKRPPRNEDNM
jgi:MFS superfamily sulfate permease-like transporter